MQRAHSPYAPALASALHSSGAELAALETALDRAFAARALAGAARLGGRLLGWVREGIDLENAWDALAGGAVFVAGGRQLSRDQHAAVAREPNEAARRGRLSRCFATSPLAGVFDEPDLATAALESRARSVRIRRERHAVRIDPLGPGPILELVMRLRAERAELRRINWGIAQGRPAEAIIGQMPRRQ
jgi:vacuolar-type H+-ATPase subunit C/Vma6